MSIIEPGIKEKARLTSPTIYEIISKEGAKELARPFSGLAWSAFVAGICISFSLFCEGIIRYHLGGEGHFFLIENLGYTVGFMLVILGRFQLFTENTITVVLPLLEKLNRFRFLRTMRLWAIVLLFNFIGCFFTAFMVTNFPFFSPEIFDEFLEISHHAMDRNLYDIFWQAIPAGFLIAALVWMLPSSESFQFWVVLLVTYIIAIGDFAHIIAGSVEIFLLNLQGDLSVWRSLELLTAISLGNIIGGTILFTFMAYAQVKEEMESQQAPKKVL